MELETLVKKLKKEIEELKKKQGVLALELQEAQEEIRKIKEGSEYTGVYLEGASDSVIKYINK